MTADIIISVDGRVGRIRLNRPKALHALTTDMCLAISAALDQFEADDAVELVVFDHAEGRGFCAGGDIRMLAESGARDGVDARAFFMAEYRMNNRLFGYAKPTVAIMDGITMGGGVGIALPCDMRIATENTKFALPETGIGLFPDVGAGWYLSRLPGQVGKYLALTGARLDGADCVALGLATHFVETDEVEALVATLVEEGGWALERLASASPPADIAAHLETIHRLFANETLDEIFAALEAAGSEWATKQLATLRSKSPLSMTVALRQLREGAAMPDFASEMAQEYAIGARMVRTPDFIEGVRALIVDKDNSPKWRPYVNPTGVDAIFAPLPAGEEWTPQ